MSRRKAYSYLRFSTPEQSKGDSRRRQTDMAERYARAHDLDLDASLSFHDEGVSGFRGKNAEAGRLADFREAVRVGLVPQGSVLLVEQLDRISRLTPRKAMRVLEDIVEAGVSVVTLNDGREYTPQSLDRDPTDFLVSMLTFFRANEESETKSRRLKQAWEAKVAQATMRPLTSIMPGWLQLNRDTETIEAIPERAAIVQRVFDLTLEGAGQNKIAETFNREGIPTWGVGRKRGTHWHRSYIVKIRDNPAVVGRMVPHKIEYHAGQKRRVPLAPIDDYFPSVVSREKWEEVRAVVATKGGARGRQAEAPVANILARIAKCPRCGGGMARVQKGKRSLPSLVCAGAKVGAGCEYKSVRYQPLEDRLLTVLPGAISDRDGLEAVDGIEARLDVLSNEIPDRQEAIEDVVDLLLEQRSPALQARLSLLELERDAMVAERMALEQHREIMAGPVVGSRITRALDALQAGDDGVIDRLKINLALRGLFKSAVINWPRGSVDLEWHLGGVCRIQYGWTGGPWLAPVE